MRSYRGRGLGGHLLTEVTRHAWTMHERRVMPHVDTVTLSTCELDADAALPNYEARGYVVVGRDEVERAVRFRSHPTGSGFLRSHSTGPGLVNGP